MFSRPGPAISQKLAGPRGPERPPLDPRSNTAYRGPWLRDTSRCSEELPSGTHFAGAAASLFGAGPPCGRFLVRDLAGPCEQMAAIPDRVDRRPTSHAARPRSTRSKTWATRPLLFSDREIVALAASHTPRRTRGVI